MDQPVQLPHDIQPLLPYVWGAFEWTMLTLGIVVLMTIVVFGFAAWDRFRSRRRKPEATIPPYDRLMKQLEELKPEANKQYYLDLSMIVREYLETFFRMRSTDMTVQEILQFLPMYLPAKFAEQPKMREFFLRVEEIVFAGRESTADEASQWHTRVGEWIKQLEVIRTPPKTQEKT